MSLSLQHTVGVNVRRIREEHGISQDTLARHMRRYGVKWNPSRIADLEAGRQALSASNFIVLAQALTTASHRNVLLADLVAGESGVVLSESLEARNDVLQTALRGLPVNILTADDVPEEDREVLAGSPAKLLAYRSGMWSRPTHERIELFMEESLSERRVANQIGVTVERLTELALAVWGEPFEAHRDAIAGLRASPQRRGRVTRDLIAELKDVLDEAG